MNYETIKRNYDRNLWSKQMIYITIKKGIITPAHFYTITGDAEMTKTFVPGLITAEEYQEITGETYHG